MEWSRSRGKRRSTQNTAMKTRAEFELTKSVVWFIDPFFTARAYTPLATLCYSVFNTRLAKEPIFSGSQISIPIQKNKERRAAERQLTKSSLFTFAWYLRSEFLSNIVLTFHDIPPIFDFIHHLSTWSHSSSIPIYSYVRCRGHQYLSYDPQSP